jgi:hypothetical protein
MEKYNPNQNYYFVDYSLWEKGHPEYIERMKKRDPSIHTETIDRDLDYDVFKKGIHRWIRQPFQTEQDVQETINFLFNPYPDKVEGLRIRSEEELNEIVTLEQKTNKILYEGDDGFEKGFKFTQREYDFGGYYQSLYEKRLMLDYCPPHPCDQEEEKEQNRT